MCIAHDDKYDDYDDNEGDDDNDDDNDNDDDDDDDDDDENDGWWTFAFVHRRQNCKPHFSPFTPT